MTRDIRTFVDVGAAHGALTLFGLEKTAASTVLAFEPNAASRSILRENLRLNGASIDDVMLSDNMVGDMKDEGTCVLDTFVDQIQLPCCVKIDVEGGEASVLRGAGCLPAMKDVRWIIETHSEALEAECPSMLQQHGYYTEIVDNDWWRSIVSESRAIDHNRWIVGHRSSFYHS